MAATNERGGFEYAIKRKDDGLLLKGDDIRAPEWTDDKGLARTEPDLDSIVDTAIGYLFTDEEDNLLPGYEIVRIPWVAQEHLDKVYDEDGNIDWKRAEDFVLGE